MDIQERKTGKNKLAITFVVLLTLCAPLGYLYFIIVMQMLSYVAEDGLKAALLLSLIPILLYWLIIGILGILNMKKSFQLYRDEDTIGCINGMLIHKYGLVIFFCANFIVLCFWYGLFSMAAVMGTRGLLLLFAPVLLPVWVVGLCISSFATWLAILPGSIYLTYHTSILFPDRCAGCHVSCGRKVEPGEEKLLGCRSLVLNFSCWNYHIDCENQKYSVRAG